MPFSQLGLHQKVLKALEKAGYTEPTAIQAKAIPKVLAGHDIRGSAQTGTGKTAAFILPALTRILTPQEKQGKKGPRVLVLAPTRELAMQIAKETEKYSKYMHNTKTVCVAGGMPISPQMRKLSQPHDLLIATPGRLIDLMERGKVPFARLEMLILDEADRMLDMGFLQPVEKIAAATPADRQTLLFSATFEKGVKELSNRLLNKPMDIIVHAQKERHENITQSLLMIDDIAHKNRLLNHILSTEKIQAALVFTSTKRHAEQLVSELKEQGLMASALHGDMNQRQRTKAVTRLKNGSSQILVATDVAARGIDVKSITHVINFDLPYNAEDYVHRIGRTGRAGASGTAISFAGGRDRMIVKKIEAFTQQKIDVQVIEGFEPRKKGQDKPKKKKPFRPYRRRQKR